mgnify:CR=1 FL=1
MPNPDAIFRSDSESPRDIDDLEFLEEDEDEEDSISDNNQK